MGSTVLLERECECDQSSLSSLSAVFKIKLDKNKARRGRGVETTGTVTLKRQDMKQPFTSVGVL